MSEEGLKEMAKAGRYLCQERLVKPRAECGEKSVVWVPGWGARCAEHAPKGGER